jgi:oligopeptide transport system substrate-binding protein
LSELGVKATDDKTLVVTLERPTAYFPWLVATWTYYPLRQDQIQQYGKMWFLPGRLVSNGPFTLETSPEDTELLLVRNPRYGGAAPQLAAIVYHAYASNDEAFSAYQKDALDVLPVFADLRPQIAKDSDLSRQVQTFAESGTSFLVLNTRRPGLSDPRVRRALGMALDRRDILNNVLQQPGEPATSLHPPGIDGRDPSVWPAEDADTARQLLAEAGFPGGKGLPAIVYSAFSPDDQLAGYLVKRWQTELGVTVNPVLVIDPTDTFRHSQQWQDQVDTYLGSWNSDYVDPSNWFNLLWDSANDPSQYNCGWKNAKFDSLVRDAQAEEDDATRTQRYQDAESLIAQDYPIIPLFYPAEQYLVKPYVRGFTPGAVGVAAPLARVRIEK